MAGEIDLYIDVVNGELVKGLNDAEPFTLPRLGQGSLLALRVFLVKPIEGAVAQPWFSQVQIDSISFRLAIGPRAGATALLAAQDVWTKQISADTEGKSQYFYANLDLNTTDLNTALGVLDSLNSYIEAQMNPGGGWQILFSAAVTVVAAVRDPTGAVTLPASAENYPTWSEADAVYLRKIASAGDRIVLSNGSFAVEIVQNADGTVGLNPVG